MGNKMGGRREDMGRRGGGATAGNNM